MSRPSLHALPLGLAPVVAAAALAGCGPEADPGAAREPTSVTIHHYSADESTWTDFGMSVLTLVFSPLVHEHSGEFEGRLARSRELSADGRTWTYHLDPEVRWHDGVPVTAHDIKFTIDLFQHPDIKNPAAVRSGRNRQVTVIDDSTFTMTFSRYRDDYAWVSVEVFLPKHLLEHLDPARFDEWDFWTQPVGNGPYRFSRMVRGQHIELVADPGYHLGKPAIEHVIVRAGGDLTAELRAGVADIKTGVGSISGGRFADDPRFNVLQWPLSRPERIYWNHRRAPFGDPAVRLALSLAIDRAELASAISYGLDNPIWDVPASPGQVRRREYPTPLPHDPVRARALLAEAGWVDTDGDGIRERDGNELRFALLGSGPIAVVIEAQLREAGAAVEILATGRDVWRQKFAEGEFDAALGPAVGARTRPSAMLSGVPGPIVGFEDPRLDSLEAALETAFLETQRDSLFREAWPIFRETMPTTLLLPRLSSGIAHRRIMGVDDLDGAALVRHLDELWIAEAE